MKLSQPKSARIINTCRILCELRRSEGVSKAELSRILELNKVSCGEIITDLEAQGLVRDAYKIDVTNGRRPIALEIVKDARYVLCVNIGSRNIAVALSDLKSGIIKLERIPYETQCREEEFCAALLKSCIRTLKPADKEKVLGIGISIAGRISIDEKVLISCPYLPWKNMALVDVFEKTLGIKTLLTTNVVSLVAAEKTVNTKSLMNVEPVLYVDWSDSISLAVVMGAKVSIVNSDFGKIKLKGEETLEDSCTPSAITGRSSIKLREIWQNIPVNSLSDMAKALNLARQVTGATKAILGGDSSSIDASCLGRIRAECFELQVDKSSLGDNANVLSASEFALDRFFYQTSLLDEVRPWI